ncbi:MAG TPA: aldo/keto reductase [Kosmotogaceae bacterium]|jgi:diketogulonate reductase-like aldo/keto reductase|nr:MAG: Aldo/keto reductase [Thermotogales bacterium 46_20]HAA86095.1 aldo/keto reductase [Kosmotogaceae bacterium]
MIYKALGSTEEKVPAIGLGTWAIGGEATPDYSKDRELIDAIAAAIDMGYTHIDTAEYYAAGHTEELVGEAMRQYDRSDLFVTSKVWPDNLTRERLPASLKGSLKRLGTDYLDLYLIHWPNRQVPLTETLEEMAKAVDAGTVRFIGVSNFDLPLLEEAVAASRYPIVCNQVLYNVEDRQPRHALLPYCQNNGITLAAYSPIRRTNLSREAEEVLKAVAKNHGCSIYQIMIAWLISQENVITIPKSTTIKHLKENLESATIKLSEGEISRIDKEIG